MNTTSKLSIFGINMNTTSKLSIFVFMAIATITPTLGTSTTFAASNTHSTRHDIQLLNSTGDDYFPTSTTLAATHPYTHYHNMQLINSVANHPTNTNSVNSIDSRNGNSDGLVDSFDPTQLESTWLTAQQK
jgi:hypothetical protein